MISNLFKKISNESMSLYINILFSYAFKGASILLSVLMTPIYIRYFSNETVLGGWFTALSILNWIMFFDFGVGNGLRNKLTDSLAAKDVQMTKKLISSTYIIMLFVMLALLTIGLVIIYFIDFNVLLDVPEYLIAPRIFKISILILFIGTLLSFYFNISTSIMHTIQKSGFTGLFSLISNFLILLSMVVFKSPNLELRFLVLSIVFSVSVSLPLIMATLLIFVGKLRDSRPKIPFFDSKIAKNVLKIGGLFFWIQLALLIINSTDQIIVTNIFGSERVVEYQIYHKLF